MKLTKSNDFISFLKRVYESRIDTINKHMQRKQFHGKRIVSSSGASKYYFLKLSSVTYPIRIHTNRFQMTHSGGETFRY